MGSLQIDCPLPESIPDIDKMICPEKLGQVQRLAFRLKQDPANLTPTFTTVTDLTTKSKWVAAMAADDETKIVITPFISGLVFPPGTPITEEGNNNNTVNGVSILQGFQTIMVQGKFLNLPTPIANQLRALTGYSALTPGFTNLEAFLLNEFGQIVTDMEPGGVIPKGFDIFNYVVPSVGSEGLNKSNVHNTQFELLGDWDQRMKYASPLKLVTGAWTPLSL